MPTLTGKDGIQIDSRIISDLAEGDCVILEFPNDLGVAKASKNGNIIYAVNENGRICEVTLKVLVGSPDDKYLNSRLKEFKSDPAKFILMTGIFAKRVGDGQGKITNIIYECSGGIFKKQVGGKTNSEADISQNSGTYTMIFEGDRTIQ